MHGLVLNNSNLYCNILAILRRSAGAHLLVLARGQQSSEETSLRWRAVEDTVSDLTGPVFEPSAPTAKCLKTEQTDLSGYDVDMIKI